MFRWTLHLSGGTERYNHYAAVGVEQKVYYFGGFCDGNINQTDVHVFNTVSLCWGKLPPVTTLRGCEPHRRENHTAENHTAVLIEYIIYILCPHCNVLYAFDVDTHRWFKPKVSGTVPEKKNHSACVLGKVLFIHGGWTQDYMATNDIYRLDTTTMVWSLINTRGTSPPFSIYHSATIIGTKMFVFGGVSKQGYNYYNIRVFDTETNCWPSTPNAHFHPEGRFSHSAFTYNGELYIFGGEAYGQDFTDLWKLNPETFSWKKFKPKGKGPGPMHGMCCCVVGDRIILCGRYKRDDLIILDLSPSLKTLCKLAVIQYGLEQSELPHNIRWELAAMTTKSM